MASPLSWSRRGSVRGARSASKHGRSDMKAELWGACVAGVFCVPLGQTFALDYPTKPVRVMVPFTAGGGVDTAGRIVAQQLTETFGQTAVVDNRPGAGSIIGTNIAAKSAADGYTLLVSHNAFVISPALYQKLPYDAVRDFAQVAIIGLTTNALVINPTVPARSVKELIAHLKSKPGELNYASAGAGGTAHLAMEYFMLATGTQLVHVPYKGAAAPLVDMVGGRIQVASMALPTTLPFINSKQLVALATTGAKRSAFLPELPTIDEAGVPGYEFDVWYGVHVPVKTPREIIVKLNTAIGKALREPAVKQRLANAGIEAAGPATPEEFAKFVRAEMEKMRKIVKASGARPE